MDKEELLQRDKVNLAIKKHNKNVPQQHERKEGRKEGKHIRQRKASVM